MLLLPYGVDERNKSTCTVLCAAAERQLPLWRRVVLGGTRRLSQRPNHADESNLFPPGSCLLRPPMLEFSRIFLVKYSSQYQYRIGVGKPVLFLFSVAEFADCFTDVAYLALSKSKPGQFQWKQLFECVPIGILRVHNTNGAALVRVCQSLGPFDKKAKRSLSAKAPGATQRAPRQHPTRLSASRRFERAILPANRPRRARETTQTA